MSASSKRFAFVFLVLGLCFLCFCVLYMHLSKSITELSAFRAAIKSTSLQFREPMNFSARDTLLETLKHLDSGGDLKHLGLGKDIPSVTHFLGDDNFDMGATIELLEDGRLRAVKANLELLGAKLDKQAIKHQRSLKYLILAAILAGAIILICLIRLFIWVNTGRDKKVHFNIEEGEGGSITQEAFLDRLSNIVQVESTTALNRAKISYHGFDLSSIEGPLLQVLTQIAENLVSNCIIHGSRSVEYRTAANKPPYLSIEVRLYDNGKNHALSVRDDGEGIDPNVIFAKAQKLGFVSHGSISEITLKECFNCLFLYGFSTRSDVQTKRDGDLSLDVLKVLAQRYRGVFTIHNQIGKYCQFLVKFPKN